jgi:outer membrane protein assembly factor BamB
MRVRPLGPLAPLTVASAITFSLAVGSLLAVEDWPQWRGPNRDGVSAERGLLKAWPKSGPTLAWRARGAGDGYSSFAAAGGRLYTMGARGGTEYVMAFDVSNGTKVWETASGSRFRNERGDGPRGTPTLDGDRLYALGASGTLSAIEIAFGRVVWKIDVLDQFAGSNIPWGLSESPLVLSDRILVNAGGRRGSIVALRKTDGALLWRSETDEAGYSSAVAHEIGGIPEAVFFTAERALGVDIRDGRLLWSYDRVSNRTANIATPIVRGNHVFVSSAYGTGAALLELTPSANGLSAKQVYFTREMMNHHASSVLIADHLYGFSNAILTAMRFSDGQVAWRDRSVGKGSLVYADERLYLFSENGVVGLAEANPAGYREHGRFTLSTGSLPTWSHPIVANGRLFLRDQDSIYAYNVRAQ